MTMIHLQLFLLSKYLIFLNRIFFGQCFLKKTYLLLKDVSNISDFRLSMILCFIVSNEVRKFTRRAEYLNNSKETFTKYIPRFTYHENHNVRHKLPYKNKQAMVMPLLITFLFFFFNQ